MGTASVQCRASPRVAWGYRANHHLRVDGFGHAIAFAVTVLVTLLGGYTAAFAQVVTRDAAISALQASGHDFSESRLLEAERALQEGDRITFTRIRDQNFCSIAVDAALALSCQYLRELETRSDRARARTRAARAPAGAPGGPPAARGASTPTIATSSDVDLWRRSHPGCGDLFEAAGDPSWTERTAATCARAFEADCRESASLGTAAESMLLWSRGAQDEPSVWRAVQRCAATRLPRSRLAELVTERSRAWVDAGRHDLVSLCLDECRLDRALRVELALLEQGLGYTARLASAMTELREAAATVDEAGLTALLERFSRVRSFMDSHAAALAERGPPLAAELESILRGVQTRFRGGVVARLEEAVAQAESALSAAEDPRTAAAHRVDGLRRARGEIDSARALIGSHGMLLGGLSRSYLPALDTLTERADTAESEIENAQSREAMIESLHGSYCSDQHALERMAELPRIMARGGVRETREEARRRLIAMNFVRDRVRQTVASLRDLEIRAATLTCCGALPRGAGESCE